MLLSEIMGYGVSCVLHGDREDKYSVGFTTTVVRGDTVDDVTVDEDKSWNLKVHHEDMRGMKAAVDRMLGTVVKVAKLQKESSSDAKKPVPTILGFDQAKIRPGELTKFLKMFYSKLFGRKSDKWGIAKAASHLFTKKVNMTKDLKGKDIHFETRAFDGRTHNPLQIAKDHNVLVPNALIVDQAKEDNLARLLERAQDGSQEALEKLREFVREDARHQARKSRSTGHTDTRFLHIGTNDPRVKDLLKNNIIQYFDLRKVYEDTYREELGIKHHVSVKCPQDPKGRPFEDVIKSYLRDQIDGIPFSRK